ncbi:MAG: stage 0 sporulation family protein [Bernardetiaceae bacterium]
MNSFDWLGNMDLPYGQVFPYVEVKFKNGRKDFYYNKLGIDVIIGDPVVVQEAKGTHIGCVALQGELVRLQMRRKRVKATEELPRILRVAQEDDLQQLKQAQARELPTMYRTREIIREMKLSMKLSDVEFQADHSKATFYYSADNRVDFRELIKCLANEFHIRVEMRQISLRAEAGRIGGIGSCGRELCCSTWLTQFKNVSTHAARYQNLSLNPAKLAGQCGRLKCCLNYELDTYLEALKDIPKADKGLQLVSGKATLEKTDIFRKVLWFSQKGTEGWTSLTAQQVQEALALNAAGVLLPSLVPEEWEETEAKAKKRRRKAKKS